MTKMQMIQIALNVIGAASAAYAVTGTWEGAAAAVALNIAALFQKPPWKEK